MHAIKKNRQLESQPLTRKTIASILAAGASSRFGSAKQLARFGDKSLLEHVETVVLSSTVDETTIVVGCGRQDLQAHVLPDVKAIENAGWSEGLASSVRCATEYAGRNNASHLLLLVCDQPFVTSCLIDKILSLSKFEPERIIACSYGDSIGVPALFPNRFFKDLLALKGDTGAKSVIKSSADVELVDFPEGVVDVDFPTDLISGSAAFTNLS